MFGLQPRLTRPIFWLLTPITGTVWISARDLEPRQLFGRPVQFLHPCAGKILAAKSFAKSLACQFWRGWLGHDPNSPSISIFRLCFKMLARHVRCQPIASQLFGMPTCLQANFLQQSNQALYQYLGHVSDQKRKIFRPCFSHQN